MELGNLLDNVQTLAIVCNQWGDTGKGKFVDLFGEWADIIARGTGGANAGHTIRIGDREFIFHLLPSGILHDDAGKINIIGSGVALDPWTLSEELKMLTDAGGSYNRLQVSYKARLVLPQHLLMDRLRESAGEDKIGTTGRGIGPVYVDHVDRIGLVLGDIFNPDVFVKKLRKNLDRKRDTLVQADPQVIKEILEHKDLGGGTFYHSTRHIDVDAVVESYRSYALELDELVTDTDEFLSYARAGSSRRILLEGAQGNLLSIDYGTYPYVTCSDCSVQGLARGVGLRDRHVDRAFGIVKAFYMTRVGKGSFPTELGGEASDRWCNTRGAGEGLELERYPAASVNSTNEFEQGVGIRKVGREYGATTRRPRRVGWLDIPLLRYSSRYTGRDTILTKLDVLDQCERIRICTNYVYEGPPHRVGGKTLRDGERLDTAIPDEEVLRHCRPEYQTFSGWMSDTSDCRRMSDLPPQLRHISEVVENLARLNLVMMSVGPDREQTIVC